MKIRTYTEMSKLPTFRERFEYLKLSGVVGRDTFGYDRYLNQQFYRSAEWRRIRDLVIVRDNACDLGIDGHEIVTRIYIHHMNPITKDDILQHSADIVDPEYLVCVTQDTHNAIHYGFGPHDGGLPIERKPNDTCPWRLHND